MMRLPSAQTAAPTAPPRWEGSRLSPDPMARDDEPFEVDDDVMHLAWAGSFGSG